MKKYISIVLILFAFVSCDKDEDPTNKIIDGHYKGTFQRELVWADSETDIVETGINFCIDEKVSDIIVKYDEIIGYDSTKHVFQVTEFAWNKLKKTINY